PMIATLQSSARIWGWSLDICKTFNIDRLKEKLDLAQQEFLADRRRRLDDLPELPEDRPALLLSAVYSGEERKVYLKFYDAKDNVIYHWRDRTDHKPYCYTKMQYEDQVEQVVQKETK